MRRANTQSSKIRQSLSDCFEIGETNKSKIFLIVSNTLGVPRPTVRREAGFLKKEYLRRAAILSAKYCKEKS